MFRSIRLGPLFARAHNTIQLPTSVGGGLGLVTLDDQGRYPRPGRRGRNDIFYARWAALYVDALAEGPNPLPCLAKAEHLNESTIRGFLHVACSGASYSPTPHLVAVGGQLTRKAETLLTKEWETCSDGPHSASHLQVQADREERDLVAGAWYTAPDGRERTKRFERRVDAERWLDAKRGRCHRRRVGRPRCRRDRSQRLRGTIGSKAEPTFDRVREVSTAGLLDRNLIPAFGVIPIAEISTRQCPQVALRPPPSAPINRCQRLPPPFDNLPVCRER